MDLIKFDLEIISNDNIVEIEGIPFSNVAYIKPFINDKNLFQLEEFEGSFIISDELSKSCNSSGEYLLFTSVSGIADDAGWEYVSVTHTDELVKWEIPRDNNLISYSFKKKDYILEVKNINQRINNLPEEIILEPKDVIFPEN